MSVKETQNIKNFKIQNSNRNFAIKSEQGPLPSAYNVRGLPERPEKLRLVISAVKTKVESQEDKSDCKRKHGTSPVLFDEFVGSAIRWNFSCRWPFIMVRFVSSELSEWCYKK